MTRRAAQLASLDLNLILVLRELLRERNVTRAAERVGVTQPAVSAALSRLRRHFGDDLLVRVSRGYVLSPLAVQLERQVEEICAAAERLFSAGADFDPASTRREFTLMMADYTVAVLGGSSTSTFRPTSLSAAGRRSRRRPRPATTAGSACTSARSAGSRMVRPCAGKKRSVELRRRRRDSGDRSDRAGGVPADGGAR
jgi:Bacterial regulatory helix-turn-helix protein, lysR family